MKTSPARQIIQNLPSELLRNPDRNAVQDFLKRKLHTFRRLKNIMAVSFIVYLVLLFLFEAFHTTVSGLAKFDNILNLLPLILFLVLAVMFYNFQKNYNIAENDIDAVIAGIKSTH